MQATHKGKELDLSYKNIRIGALVLASIIATGCTVKPQAVSNAELKAANAQDLAVITNLGDPIEGKLTLDQAIDRAFEYNLDHYVRRLERSLLEKQLEESKFDQLPKLVGSAGYTWTTTDGVRNSRSVTADPTDDPVTGSISTDREKTAFDLGLSWSVLDFGASYYRAKQTADRALVAEERRRKVMHNLSQSVRTSFWRALAAQELKGEIRNTLRDAQKALENSKESSAEGLTNPGDAWRYQRSVVENLRLLESIQDELSTAQTDLARLIGVLPGTDFQLVRPDWELPKPIEHDIVLLEGIALLNNADIREQYYNTRIAALETRSAMLKLLPGISFEYGRNYDTDSWLYENQWSDAGIRVSFNLFNLLSAPIKQEASEAAEELAKSRRIAMQMAVLSQVHLASQQYHNSLRQFERATDIRELDTNLARLARDLEENQAGDELTTIGSAVTEILSTVRYYQAVAQVYEASGRLRASLGLSEGDGINRASVTGDINLAITANIEADTSL